MHTDIILGESMESKKQLLEIVSKTSKDKSEYFLKLFQYIPEVIAKEFIYSEVNKNEYILFAGELSDTIYILLSGRVVGLDHQKMGRIYSFMDFTEMYVLGDFEIFGGTTENCITIRAAEKCKLLKISSKSYLRWIRQDADALFLRLNNIVNIFTLEKKIDREFLFMTCKERLAHFLAKYYKQEMNSPCDVVKVSSTQAELADKTGFNIRSIQRNILSLEKENLISNENGKIIISYEQYLKLNDYLEKTERS